MESFGASADEIADMIEDIRIARTLADEADADIMQRAKIFTRIRIWDCS